MQSAERLLGNITLHKILTDNAGDYDLNPKRIQEGADLSKPWYNIGQYGAAIKELRKQQRLIAGNRVVRTRKEKQAERKWDWARNHGRKAYAAARDTYAPPTFAVRDTSTPTHPFTFNVERIHDLFLQTWAKIYCAHRKSPPAWQAFHARYGEDVPYADPPSVDVSGAELQQQLVGMKNTSPGFDGWSREALLLLPLAMWEDRARIENLALSLGKLPLAYAHVPNPMLPKGHAEYAEDHRGLTIFSMLHRISYGVQWKRLRQWQDSWICDSQHGGRAGGEFMADAWDLQAAIEIARGEGHPLVGALLDYAKCFDMFEPNFVFGLMVAVGLPKPLAFQIRWLYTRLQRYFRVAGSYGAVLRQANGVGQGCSVSLLIANAYVSVLIRHIRRHYPSVSVSAFIDDRNLVSRIASEIIKAVGAIKNMDQAAGHFTNIAKSSVFALHKDDREELRQTTIGTQRLQVVNDAKMVGHRITTKRQKTDWLLKREQ